MWLLLCLDVMLLYAVLYVMLSCLNVVAVMLGCDVVVCGVVQRKFDGICMYILPSVDKRGGEGAGTFIHESLCTKRYHHHQREGCL